MYCNNVRQMKWEYCGGWGIILGCYRNPNLLDGKYFEQWEHEPIDDEYYTLRIQ